MWGFAIFNLLTYYVYILTNYNTTVLYTGFTDNLYRRVQEHKHKLYRKSFSAKYNTDRLVYYKEFDDKEDAFAYERKLKRYKREWKENLISEMNPNFQDLSEEFEV